jgi:hypothetical protein
MNALVEADDDLGTEERRSSLVRRLWAAPLWFHAGALLLILLALLPLMSPNSSFASDEGAYALQVEALEAGSWAYDYRAAPLDPEGRYFPIYLSTRTPSGYYPYVKHPAYPLLLQGARRLAGPTLGLHLLALLGTVGAAAAAWLLAGEFDHRLSRPSFWVAATGPVLVNGFLIWAHAPSAALAGFALLCAARIARHGYRPLATAALVASLAAGVLLRSEALLFAGALALALSWSWFRKGGRRRAVPALLLGLPALGATLVERAWITRLVGQPLDTLNVRRGDISYLAGRVSGASHELVNNPGQDPGSFLPLLLALGLVVGLGYLALRRWGPRSRAGLLAATAGVLGLLLVRFVGHPYVPVTGLLAAWPLALLGLLLVRHERLGPAGALLGLTAGLFVTLVLLTQYPEGGATEWGGRFLSPALVPLAVLATAGLSAALRRVPGRERSLAAGLLATIALAYGAFGLATTGAQRARVERVTQAVARYASSVPGRSDSPVTLTVQGFLPRAGWAVNEQVRWMYVDSADLAAAMADLRARGAAEVRVVVPYHVRPALLAAFPHVQEIHEPDLEDVGLTLYLAFT